MVLPPGTVLRVSANYPAVVTASFEEVFDNNFFSTNLFIPSNQFRELSGPAPGRRRVIHALYPAPTQIPSLSFADPPLNTSGLVEIFLRPASGQPAQLVTRSYVPQTIFRVSESLYGNGLGTYTKKRAKFPGFISLIQNPIVIENGGAVRFRCSAARGLTLSVVYQDI
jgi:hypothetical protein